jgi:hypothetical protein
MEIEFLRLQGSRPRRNRGRTLIISLIVIVCVAAAAFFVLHRLYRARLAGPVRAPGHYASACPTAPRAAGAGPLPGYVGGQIHTL